MSQVWGSVPRWECGFPISLDSGVFAAWDSLHFSSQLGHLHPAAFPRLPQLLLCQDWGIAGVMLWGLIPLQDRAATSPGVLLSVVPPLWFLLFLVQPLPVGTDNLLGQGNCIRGCATPRAGGAPGSCPDLSFPVTHKHPKDHTASCSRSAQTFLRAWQGKTGVPGGALVALVGPFRPCSQGIWGWKALTSPGHRCVHVRASAHHLCVFARSQLRVCPCLSVPTRAFPAQQLPWQGLCRGQVTRGIQTLPRLSTHVLPVT